MKKSFVVLSTGLLAVVLAVFVSRSWRPSGSEIEPKNSLPAAATRPSHAAIGRRESPEPKAPPPTIVAAARLQSPEAAHAAHANTPTRATTRSAQQDAATLTEEEARALCMRVSDRRFKAEQAARDSEVKDPSWAYPMEQSLSRFLASRGESVHLEVARIDCKSISCEVTARGTSPEAHKAFESVIRAITEQPWNDFSGFEIRPMDREGNLKLGRLTLAEPPSTNEDVEQLSASTLEEREATLCLEWRDLDRQRAQAAMDGEAKDPSWAYPMEQLLREHIISELGRHRIERFKIDCRTTYCALEASGTSEQAALAFQQISQAVWREPWSDLTLGGVGGTGYGSSWTQHVLLRRRSSDGEKIAMPQR